MKTSNRERRDWTLLIFLIPIGIIFMLIAGQFAVRLVPVWRVNAGMQSKLDPNNLPVQQNVPLQPISPAILTPLGWLDTFLTPGAGSGDQSIVFPPFVVFEPSATPAVTASPPPTVATTQPSPTIPVTKTPTVVVVPPSPTRTKKPPVDPPTAIPPTSTPPTPTPPTPTPIPTGYPSTPPVLYALVTPPPLGLDAGATATPDGNVGNIPSGPFGSYTVVYLGATGVVVSNTPDANYDLIFYESLYGPGQIALDHISIGISDAPDGSSYYEVFNWGDNDPVDTNANTNVDTNVLPAGPPCLGAPECDNRIIQTADLYTDPVTGISTGILIDVDSAPSAPPEGTYNYLVILSPPSLDAAQVDAVVVTEVP